MSNTRRLILFWILVILVLAAVGGLTWTNYRYAVNNPGGNDFLARWMGARYWLLEGVSPYDERVSLATQEMIYGHPADPAKGEDKNHFVYPLTSMLFFGPFGLLDFTLARALWMTVIELSLFVLAILSIQLSGWRLSPFKLAILILFSLFWYHGVRTVVIGQFAALNAVLITLALWLIRRKRDLASGLILSLTLAKPQMSFLIIPIILLWALSVRKWEIWWGFLIGFIGTVGLSLVFLPEWPLEMVQQVLDYPNYTNIGSPLSIIANAAPGISQYLSLLLHIIFILYIAVEWFLVWGKDERHLTWTALMTIVITNLVSPRTATTNYVMMLPILYLIFSIGENRWGMGGKLFTWISLLALSVGLWVLFIFTVQGNVEQPIMYLPLPFYCLIGLWWVRYWALQPPRLPFDEITLRLSN